MIIYGIEFKTLVESKKSYGSLTEVFPRKSKTNRKKQTEEIIIKKQNKKNKMEMLI